MKPLSLGSVFDGSGGFALGAELNGIIPVWASEIEPYCIRVTTKRLPQMKHYGDICKLDGGKLPPVDIISFGSPCTDISLAGKHAGLHGAQSGLFFQAIRVIKEMREATNGEYPRYVIWENVPGALSSQQGQDFRAVLTELTQIKDPTASIPMPKKRKWLPAGGIVGDHYSLAYRVLNSQFWGVPQRRRRVYLVADFGGECAGKILFDFEGLSGYSPKSTKERCHPAADIEAGTGIPSEPASVYAVEHHPHDSRIKLQPDGVVQTLTRRMGTGGCNVPLILSERDRKLPVQENMAYSLLGSDYKGAQCVLDTGPGPNSSHLIRRLTPTECARLQGFSPLWCANLQTENPTEEEITWWGNVFEEYRQITGATKKPKTRRQIIKWLKSPHTDAAAYKMWGNGITLPCVCFVMAGIRWSANKEQ